jgi:hypothetical protein
MEAEEKTKYRDAAAAEAADVEAHKFVIEEPSEDEADKTKTKTKYAASRRDEDAGKYKY